MSNQPIAKHAIRIEHLWAMITTPPLKQNLASFRKFHPRSYSWLPPAPKASAELRTNPTPNAHPSASSTELDWSLHPHHRDGHAPVSNRKAKVHSPLAATMANPRFLARRVALE